ncbi:MvaI/BcnI family restriction endonuclease [Vibrio metschnikovii]|uniref:MvaI/BcnI family restriction endonuclease n=1 Tax=Vibrio metschnikovii TaxID=28172 RepID=UPI0016472C40|nr:MvaI/BcnI family restriction endonuclease [Vibrio metschnikovii]MBC3616597.1 MvaI/BcnI restriction endonuclease family protein [Vibrio metschnikovii]MBC5812829.1 MvaI/BcnI restriction endonuclease family protein [Vibrio metschnikovii]
MKTIPKKSLISVKTAKKDAKDKKKKLGLKHAEALDIVAKEHGFENWKAYLKEATANQQAQISIPSPSTTFVEYEDVEMSEDDYEILDSEREDDLSFEVKKRVSANKKQLTKVGVEFSIFEPTMTGLNKSILDATQPVRTHFEIENFHFYWEQGQGPEHKVVQKAYFVSDSALTPSKASLYRPKTKNGDPRMWFRGLPSFAKPGDQVAIVIKDGHPHLLNLSEIDIEVSLTKETSFVNQFISSLRVGPTDTAMELLELLKELAKAPYPAQRKGDTAVGYTLETNLGITANSSKLPDYKGIEIKSGRGVKTRTTLFAQVADWELSPCKKSAEILNKYGYERDDDFKLYCTISTKQENQQGLSFIYDQAKDELQEWYKKTDLVAVWPGKLLRSRLKEKHAETFWVEAKSEVIDGVEHFQLVKVTHTKFPIISQLMPLIQSGVITMDHLIKRNGKTNRVSEKGPLFKIHKSNLDLLFPESVVYSLV